MLLGKAAVKLCYPNTNSAECWLSATNPEKSKKPMVAFLLPTVCGCFCQLQGQ